MKAGVSLLCAGIVALAALALAGGCSQTPSTIELSGPAQGTTYHATITQAPADLSPAQVRQRIRGVIDTIGRQMSSWRDDSEISCFNAAPAGQWVPVSKALAGLTQAALNIGHATGGAFDITVGPILALWGFGPHEHRPAHLPSPDAIQAARQKTGLDLIEVRSNPPALRKTRAGATIDLAGLAQGYTVDRMADALNALGATHYLVELGGELYARGDKKNGHKWRIGMEKPEAGVRDIDRVVGLKNAGMTTSGDYRDFFQIDSHRFSHTIDPRTGRPVAHHLHAVTVIADNAMTADAMATALLVMGPKAGMAYANAHHLATLFVTGPKGAYTESHSKAFEPYLQDRP